MQLLTQSTMLNANNLIVMYLLCSHRTGTELPKGCVPMLTEDRAMLSLQKHDHVFFGVLFQCHCHVSYKQTNIDKTKHRQDKSQTRQTVMISGLNPGRFDSLLSCTRFGLRYRLRSSRAFWRIGLQAVSTRTKNIHFCRNIQNKTKQKQKLRRRQKEFIE